MSDQPLPRRVHLQRELQQLGRDAKRVSQRRLSRAAAGAAATLLVGLNAAPALAATTSTECVETCVVQDPFQVVATDALKLSSDASSLDDQALKIETGSKAVLDFLKLEGGSLKLTLSSDALKLYDGAIKLANDSHKLGDQALKLDGLAIKWDADYLKLQSSDVTTGYKDAVAHKLSDVQQFSLKLDGFDAGLQQTALKLNSDYLKLLSEVSGESTIPTTS